MNIERGYKTDLKFKSLLEAIKYFSDEQVCRQYLECKRWNGQVTCLHCKHDAVMRLGDGKTYKCKKCRRKFSLTSGTIFQDSNLPLSIWLPAIYMMSSHWKGISSVQLAKHLGIQQTTAWYMGQRVRKMIAAKNMEMLAGVVEVDESYMKDGKKLGARTAKIRGTTG